MYVCVYLCVLVCVCVCVFVCIRAWMCVCVCMHLLMHPLKLNPKYQYGSENHQKGSNSIYMLEQNIVGSSDWIGYLNNLLFKYDEEYLSKVEEILDWLAFGWKEVLLEVLTFWSIFFGVFFSEITYTYYKM